MADVKTIYGSATALTFSDLQTLANGSSSVSSARDNSTDGATDDHVAVTIVTGASGATSASTVEIWASASIDGTNYADATNDARIGVLVTAATSTTYRAVFPIAVAFGGQLPQRYRIRVRNATGGALAGSGNAVSYLPVLTTVS